MQTRDKMKTENYYFRAYLFPTFQSFSFAQLASNLFFSVIFSSFHKIFICSNYLWFFHQCATSKLVFDFLCFKNYKLR